MKRDDQEKLANMPHLDERGEPPPRRRRTGRREWCRGRVGQQHEPEWRSYAELKRPSLVGRAFVGWKIQVCRRCGKYLEFYYPWQKKEEVEKK